MMQSTSLPGDTLLTVRGLGSHCSKPFEMVKKRKNGHLPENMLEDSVMEAFLKRLDPANPELLETLPSILISGTIPRP